MKNKQNCNATNNPTPGKHVSELFTASEVAELLKVAPSTVYNWSKTGKIKCYILSKGKRKSTIRFDRDQIDRFISKSSEGRK